jgi:general secretion pathway protein N
MSDRSVIYLGLVGCVLGGAILLLEPSAANEVAITELLARGDIVPATRPELRARVAELLATARDRPLFSATRRPTQQAEGSSELADTRLTGIIVEPDRRLAIFAVSDAKPVALTEGETLNGWQIENITPREVSLSGPTGIKTLHLRVDANRTAAPRRTDARAPVRTTREVAAEAPPGVQAAVPPAGAAVQPKLDTASRAVAVRQPKAQTDQPRSRP